MDPRNTKLIKSVATIGAGRVFTQLLNIVLIPLYTSFLNPRELGAIDLIFTYLALAASVISLQLEMAVLRFLIDARGNRDEMIKIISNVFQIVAITLILALSIFFISSFFLEIEYLGLIIMNILILIISNILIQIARGLGDNKRFAIANVINSVITLASIAVLVVVGKKGAIGVLLAFALANIICSLYIFFSLKLYQYIKLSNRDMVMKKRLLLFSLPLIPNGLSWWIISVSDRTIISISVGLAANGIYAISAKYSLVFTSLFAIFSMALIESVSMNVTNKDFKKHLSKISNSSLKLFGSLGLVLIAVCPFLFRLLVGVEFRSAQMYVPILIIAAFFNSIVGVYSAVYIAKKMTRQVATTTAIAALINLTLTLLFVARYGIYAAAFATAFAYFFVALYRHFSLRKIVHISYEKWLIAKLTLAYVSVLTIFYAGGTAGRFLNIVLVVFLSIVFNKKHIIYLVSTSYKKFLNSRKLASNYIGQ